MAPGLESEAPPKSAGLQQRHARNPEVGGRLLLLLALLGCVWLLLASFYTELPTLLS